MKSLIKKLVESTGPSGYETQVRSIIREEIAPFTDELQVDNLGNLIARKGLRSGQGLKLMLAAHMDEIGLIITHVDEKGFARFASNGVLDPLALLGNRVVFLSGARGVIGSELTSGSSEIPSIQEMFVDLGVSSRADCPVQVGDMAVFERSFMDLGNRIVGKALDDRVGVALLIQVIQQISKDGTVCPHELYFVFSAQEEIGSRGATVAAFGIEPDLGLVVDVTTSSGTPKGPKMAVELGKGPAIKVRDEFMLSDSRIVDWMVRTAKEAKLPYQMEILQNGTTDGRVIQLSRSGVPVGGLSIPARYIHTQSEMIDYDDLQQAARLLIKLVCKPITL